MIAWHMRGDWFEAAEASHRALREASREGKQTTHMRKSTQNKPLQKAVFPLMTVSGLFTTR